MRISLLLFAMLSSLPFAIAQNAPVKPYLASTSELSFSKQTVHDYFMQGEKNSCITIIQLKQGWGKYQAGRSINKDQIQINNKNYWHGIGTHANSELLVRLTGKGKRFTAEAGYDNNQYTRTNAKSKVIFSVSVKGKTLWKSPALFISDSLAYVDIPLKGATEFILKVESTDSNIRWTHVDWANAMVELENGKREFLDENQNMFFKSQLFSFMLDGGSSKDFLRTWKYSVQDSLTANKIHHLIKWTKPDGSFEVRCQLTEFTQHPAVEWKLFFKNTSLQNSPVLQNIRTLDAEINSLYSSYSSNILYCNKGSFNSRHDYTPIYINFEENQTYRMESFEGRSCERYLPFWNLQTPLRGIVVAFGWSGDWDADFSNKTSDSSFKMSAGLSHVNLYLKPGEEISSPSVCLLYYEGNDRLRGHNLFRRYMREESTPKWNGKEPITLAMSGGAPSLEGVREKYLADYIKKIAGTGAEIFWLDAGWYKAGLKEEWSEGRGNWSPDKNKFPHGMKYLSDVVHANNMKFLLWFEPEAVCPFTDISNEHPEWVIRRNEYEQGAFNLSNPEALKYITDLISHNIKEWGIDVFRTDFNFNPGPFWEMADEKGRRGITEIRYVEGLYQFWDTLLKRNPGLLIDNCASGGRRIDYETCKRSVPLWRSDYECESHDDLYEASQNQTYALSYYLPYHSTGQGMTFDKYKDRSLATASVVLSLGPALPDSFTIVPFERVKKGWDDIKSYNYLFQGDYYPLTKFSLEKDVWMALQFDMPERKEGCLICYRRAEAPFTEAEFHLNAIDTKATYKLIYLNSGEERIVKGAQLSNLLIRLNRQESEVVKYIKQ